MQTQLPRNVKVLAPISKNTRVTEAVSINIHVYEHSVVMHTDAMLGNDSAQRLGPPQEV